MAKAPLIKERFSAKMNRSIRKKNWWQAPSSTRYGQIQKWRLIQYSTFLLLDRFTERHCAAPHSYATTSRAQNQTGTFTSSKVTLYSWNHSRRKWETFSDATCSCGLPIYMTKGSLCSGRGRNPPDLPEQAAFHPVSRRPTQTSGVRKRLPFSMCIRPEVTPPLLSHLDWDGFHSCN